MDSGRNGRSLWQPSKRSGFGGQERRKGSLPMGREPPTAAGMVTPAPTLDPIHMLEVSSVNASKKGRRLTDACGAGAR